MKKPQKKILPNKSVNYPYDHSILFGLLIFGLLAMIFFKDTLFLGMQYGAPDIQASGSNSAPLVRYYQETGKLPLWSSYIFCGMPSFASSMYNPDVYFPSAFINSLFSLPGVVYLGSILYFGYKAWPKAEEQNVVTALTIWFVLAVSIYMTNFVFDGYEIFTSIGGAVTNIFWAAIIIILCRFAATYKNWTWRRAVLAATLNYVVIYFLILPT